MRIAEAAHDAGATVQLISGPVTLAKRRMVLNCISVIYSTRDV